MKKLSVVLATRNEEANIGPCLKSVKGIADEIIIADEGSTDKTREIAKGYGAKVYKVKHQPIFHKTKQKAMDEATGDWILQMDADERVTPELSQEIRAVLSMGYKELRNRKPKDLKKWKLFKKHQRIIEKRDGKVGKDVRRRQGDGGQVGEVVAFFIPRLNFFLGKPLHYAGVYPDANIRLIKKGKGRFPAKSVHEQMEVDGEVAWLFSDLEHHDSPTLKRYLERANRYTDLHAKELQISHVNLLGRSVAGKTPKNFLYFFVYTVHRPLLTFLNLYIRHKGLLDGMRGFIWSLFSALHFPIAYFKYWQEGKK